MPTWIIEPRDPLIVRDGRPFGPDPGVRAASLAFPFPSTTTGGARNRAGLDEGGLFDRGRIGAVKAIAVRGPLLVELDADEQPTWYAPAPADALALAVSDDDKAVRIRRLAPLEPPAGAATSLDDDLRPVGLPWREKAKVSKGAPQFWRWDQFAAWLEQPRDGTWKRDELGLRGLPRDTRMHVSISGDSKTASEGALFQTVGLSFTGEGRRRLALAVAAGDAFPHFAGGFAPLAGERRLVVWRLAGDGLPSCPPAVREAVARDGACRLLLLTPALFAAGYRPTHLLAPAHGVTPRLVAACVPRAQVVSGWDMEARRPKPTRRMAPAGSVYFLALDGTPAARAAWLDATWMRCVSDDDQDRRDGFGLAALGAWDGRPMSMGENDARI